VYLVLVKNPSILPAAANRLTKNLIGSISAISEISTSGNMPESSTNVSSGIWIIEWPLCAVFLSELPIFSKIVYGIKEVQKSAILIASLSITSHKAWHMASSSILPDARPFVWEYGNALTAGGFAKYLDNASCAGTRTVSLFSKSKPICSHWFSHP
jgi:hypothetical protein